MSDQKKTFKVVTLGCRTNQYESQAYHNQLETMGYALSENDDQPDICVVNTCTVTESADTSSRYQIRQLAKKHPNAKIIVTGCSAERQPEVIAAMKGVSAVVSNSDKHNLLKKVFPNEETLPEFSIKRFDSHTRAFVKVQDGCNSFCTYCVIPYVRGRSRSRTLNEVVLECKQLISNGYKEIVLTGINIGDFDGAKEEDTQPDTLADLVRAVDAIPGLERLRISSIDPDEVDDDLLDAVINGKNTCHSMHIVLQAGSNVILKRMNRKYTRQMFFDTVERLKNASPLFTFTTDIIVGFPGETERDHLDTLEAMREVKFAKVHMFPYSDRPKTKSSTMPNKVPSDIINRRKQEVLRLSEHISYELRDQYVGERMKVLLERGDHTRPGEICGHTDNFLMVWVPSEGLSSNQIIEVDLIENTPQGLIGRLVNTSSENLVLCG
jgi:threonylcarbamoyladenosine tRNA methylthiotransferase MtaB